MTISKEHQILVDQVEKQERDNAHMKAWASNPVLRKPMPWDIPVVKKTWWQFWK